MTGRADHLPMPGDPIGWAVLYGAHHEHRALYLERERAELKARDLHGLLYPVVIGGPAEPVPYGLDQGAE